MSEAIEKSAIRRQLRETLKDIDPVQRHARSMAACSLLAATPEFAAARIVMLFLSTPHEIDTTPLALKCWQTGKTVCAPRVSWDQRRMLPIEISSLQTGMETLDRGIRQPIDGKPVPIEFLDLVIVPGLGFTVDGYRIGRGMGFYDRFLAQPDFAGLSCALAFEEQVVPSLPLQDHDMPLSMMVTPWEVHRFASNSVQHAVS